MKNVFFRSKMAARLIAVALFAILFSGSVFAEGITSAAKKIVMIAGKPSHGIGEHEFNSGVSIFKQCLDGFPGIEVVTYSNGWPKDADALKGASAIVLYMDGGANHAALQDDHLQQLAAAVKAGAGLACLHYAVEVPTNHGGAEWLDWIGGYFEAWWSVNPTWVGEFKDLPVHPITRGVKPITIKDEWYYHMRFKDTGVTPILSAVPPESTREGKDDAHNGNPTVRARKGMSEIVAWTYDRPDGGRGFGFTGGHYNKNWANEDFRKLVLNAILWTAKVEVPADGVKSTLTDEDLTKNLDAKGKHKR